MLRSALSWTRSLPSRMRERRAARRRERLQEALTPLLMEALRPMAEAMARLDSSQRELARMLAPLAEPRVLQIPELDELRELQLETLQMLQPPAETVVAQLTGLRAPPTSPRSSAS